MTGKLVTSIPSNRLLNRILEEPQFIAVIQKLNGRALNKLIHHIGIEDCGEIIALATTGQLEQVFDEDLWRGAHPGDEETFDSRRFALWLEIMQETGPDFVARTLAGMDEDFVTMALSQQTLVVDLDELTLRMLNRTEDEPFDDRFLETALEGSLNCEFGKYLVISKSLDSWDAIVRAMASLDAHHHSYLMRILERCCHLSFEYIEDNGGLYNVLTTSEQLSSDVAADREERREQAGFVPPTAALGFLNLARRAEMDELMESGTVDAITKSYFRTINEAWANDSLAAAGNQPAPGAPGGADATPTEKMAQFIQLLGEIDAIPAPEKTQLLEESRTGRQGRENRLIRDAMFELREADGKLYSLRMHELNYLANILISGCGYHSRSLRQSEAAEIVLATGNLGLEYLLSVRPAAPGGPLPGPVLADHDIVKLFKIGWNILYREVTLKAGTALTAALHLWLHAPAPPARTARAAKAVAGLCRQLEQDLAQDRPWNSRKKLTVLECVFDQPTIHALQTLLDECPSLPPLAAGQDEETSRDDEFISRKEQIERIHAFAAALQERFRGDLP
ncbi:hypothetical protein F6V25_14810 [Oryzomonas japonica]|uniref:Uncharacterized protein n=1 Tax=Oryzomonas japonica TaxID=2603858 RepID=A0A7J4ZMY6_9BACT|nr:DUF6178 family protein [Oryzomonas japonica]KAB0664073.1 hypothetical protein F6V25_14810 [Oryzomonas japonica]